MLDWMMNQADETTMLGDLPLSASELRLLMPARETRNAARRLVLHVAVADGRRHRRLQCIDGIAALRLSLTLPGVLRLNIGPPRRNEKSDRGAALDLLREVRETVAFSLVPASRDAQSESFARALYEAVLAKLTGKATHRGRSGAPSEYRRVKRALDEIRDTTQGLIDPLWQEVQRELPPGMTVSAKIGADLDPTVLVDWIASRTALRVATGDHDRGTVEPRELGSGLQSLLELAIQQTRTEGDETERVIAVEEPEAFLHPAAQRTLARMLFERDTAKRLISTHSPVLVEEARFGETVLVRDHRFYAPAEVDDAVRDEINTALLVGYGAEMSFARSVLLVEGEGDRAFYEGLRRRMARTINDGRLDHLTVVPVGSKNSYRPWLQMLSRYGTEGDRPIRWLVLADGDAATAVRQAHSQAGLRLSSELRAALMAAASQRNSGTATFVAATDAVNALARRTGAALHLSPIDLEHAITAACTDEVAADLADKLGLQASTRAELEVSLRNSKKPHMRAALAERMPAAALSPDTRLILRRWLEPVMSRAAAGQVVRRALPF